MKKTIIFLLTMLPCIAFAQKANLRQYLKGQVPVEDNKVVFSKTYKVEGSTQAQLYSKLLDYTQQLITKTNHPDQSRLTLQKPDEGYLVANLQETIYFRKKAWSSDFSEMAYRTLYTIKDGEFTIKIQDIRYQYEGDNLVAEKWITDEYALRKDGKELAKYSGKFRRYTIDYVSELMENAYQACK